MLKRELTKIEKYAIISLAIIACLYLYITKVHSPIYKNYKQTKASLTTIDNEVRSLGSKPNVDKVREELEAMEEEAKEVNNELYQIVNNNKSQTLDSAMDTLVHVNKLSLINGITVDKIMLSSKYLNPKSSDGENKDSENKEQESESGEEEKSTQEEGQEKEIAQTIKDGPLNHFDWQVYDIHFQGGYTNIANFIDSLKNTDKIVRIDYITLNRAGDDDVYSAYIKIYI